MNCLRPPASNIAMTIPANISALIQARSLIQSAIQRIKL